MRFLMETSLFEFIRFIIWICIFSTPIFLSYAHRKDSDNPDERFLYGIMLYLAFCVQSVLVVSLHSGLIK